MSDDVAIRAACPEDMDAIWHVREQAFSPDAEARTWFRERHDTDGRLVAERDGRVVGTSQVVPLGQYFGGRCVPMGAVASVAVEAESRGRGVAAALMRRAIEDMRDAGLAVSMLYASTVRLYRGLGYEIAGEGTATTIPTMAFGVADPGEPDRLRPGDERDLAAVRDCYDRVAPTRNGWLARTDTWWDRYRYLPREGWFLTVFERDGRVDGYSLRSQRRDSVCSTGGMVLMLHELVAADAVVATTLWRSLGAQSMQAGHATVVSLPPEELLLVLPEQVDVLRPQASNRTLSRIVDLAAAVAARGFPPGVEARVGLEVEDHVVDANSGRFVLEVNGGEGRIRPGGAGAVRAGIGALAALYTGWISATSLVRHARLRGRPEDVAALDACFAGPTPWCFDHF